MSPASASRWTAGSPSTDLEGRRRYGAARQYGQDMAVIEQATLRPSKAEALAAWLPDQPWSGVVAGAPLEVVGQFRFDDPAGEVGIEVLLLGAGPTGLILAQLLKLNGASRVVIAANKGIKMDIAKTLNAADESIELDRKAPEAQWQKLKDDNPYGFDVVVEATGVEKIANESINYVRRGGTLMIYGVYEDKALVHWPPSKVRVFIPEF